MVDVNGNAVLTQAALEVQPALVPLPAVSVSIAPITAPPVQVQVDTTVTVEANLLLVPIA